MHTWGTKSNDRVSKQKDKSCDSEKTNDVYLHRVYTFKKEIVD